MKEKNLLHTVRLVICYSCDVSKMGGYADWSFCSFVVQPANVVGFPNWHVSGCQEQVGWGSWQLISYSYFWSLSMAISFEKDENGTWTWHTLHFKGCYIQLPFCKVYNVNTPLWTILQVTMFGGIVQIGKQSWSICGSTLFCPNFLQHCADIAN